MKHYVVTIARGFGSGGRSIGKQLAEELGIHFYEREILKKASEASGIKEQYFWEHDEKLSRKMKYFPSDSFKETDVLFPENRKFISQDELFSEQAKIIAKLAETESCVIVGKCADYVLREYDNVLTVYIDAPIQACIQSIQQKMSIYPSEAERIIRKTDKYRRAYYKYYTKREWKDPVNYDLFLNSEKLGRHRCVELLKWCVWDKFGEKEEAQ